MLLWKRVSRVTNDQGDTSALKSRSTAIYSTSILQICYIIVTRGRSARLLIISQYVVFCHCVDLALAIDFFVAHSTD